MVRLVVDAREPDRETIARAAAIVRAGGVAAVPTDTLYGLAVDPFDASAVGRLFTIKSRSQERALPLVAADAGQVRAVLGVLSPLGERLASSFWPGPLTLVMRAPEGLAVEVTGGGTTVGVRVPADAVVRALCAAVGTPLTATSANVSGQPPTANPDDVAAALGGSIDVLVDSGRTRGGPPSTIVDVTGPVPHLIRAGAVEWEHVLAAAGAAPPQEPNAPRS
ncbi:MAG: L-threonylcarbamoyladenylate synthase [Vicinamibacterales bacterium]